MGPIFGAAFEARGRGGHASILDRIEEMLSTDALAIIL